MPELPELQAHAERLDELFVGAVLQDFRPITFTALKTFRPDPADAVGSAVRSVTRRGKYLIIEFDALSFVVHLMQGGRLEPDDKQSAKPRGGIARWTFEDGGALLLTEPGKERKAGVWVVAGDVQSQDPVIGLGPDADQVDVETLATLLQQSSRRLHGFLRDQQPMAGLGRRLANEICHRAKISPFATTTKLDSDQVTQLHAAIHDVLAESLTEDRGRDKMVKTAERTSAVHRRAGVPCPVCGDEIRAVSYRSYEVDYCPTCQTGGKVLADNTTSKFLK